jgi:hypothetical protein
MLWSLSTPRFRAGWMKSKTTGSQYRRQHSSSIARLSAADIPIKRPLPEKKIETGSSAFPVSCKRLLIHHLRQWPMETANPGWLCYDCHTYPSCRTETGDQKTVRAATLSTRRRTGSSGKTSSTSDPELSTVYLAPQLGQKPRFFQLLIRQLNVSRGIANRFVFEVLPNAPRRSLEFAEVTDR